MEKEVNSELIIAEVLNETYPGPREERQESSSEKLTKTTTQTALLHTSLKYALCSHGHKAGYYFPYGDHTFLLPLCNICNEILYPQRD